MPPSIKTATTKGIEIEIQPESWAIDTTGNIRDSSTSKIKKIITSKKYRVVKGEQEPTNGSNPHSNGVDFSVLERPAAIKANISNSKAIIKGIKIISITRRYKSQTYSKIISSF